MQTKGLITEITTFYPELATGAVSAQFAASNRSARTVVTIHVNEPWSQRVKDYFKKHKKDKHLVKYANFYFLLYLAKIIDVNVKYYN